MSPRSLKMLSAMITVLWATSSPAQNAAELSRRLKLLDLPVDLKSKALIAAASDRVNKCFEQAAIKAISSGTKDVTGAACKACDKSHAEYGRAFFEGNKHRLPDETVEKSTESSKKFCETFGFIKALELRRNFESEVVQTANYGVFGTWNVEGRTTREGVVSYALVGHGEPEMTVEFVCTPISNWTKTMIIAKNFSAHERNDRVIVTYVADAGSLKQSYGSHSAAASEIYLIKEMQLNDGLWAEAKKAKGSLNLSTLGNSAVFSMQGFQISMPLIASKCFN